MSLSSEYSYEWRKIHNGIGYTPNVRGAAASWIFDNRIWIACGEGSGLGKSSDIWNFDLSTKIWRKVQVTTSDEPSGRDGVAGTYIGQGKFIIFGGQGFSEPNKKLGRESDTMKTQTYCKRDVYNDIWQFDCTCLKWTPLYPEGLSFPMGRRGSSIIYYEKTSSVDNPSHLDGVHHNFNDENADSRSFSTFNSSTTGRHSRQYSKHLLNTESHSSLHAKSTHTLSSLACIPENSLVVFGGAGIELSKYTEQLYNDVWAYSFDNNTWVLCETRGMIPHPVTNHCVQRVADNMIIAGGIVGTVNRNMPQSLCEEAPPDADIQILNLSTATWSVLRPFDSFGNHFRFNLLGFSFVPETEAGRFIIFGGQDVIDQYIASTSKALKYKKSYPNDATLLLNITNNAIVPLNAKGNGPERRFGHITVSGTLKDKQEGSDKFKPKNQKKVTSYYGGRSARGSAMNGADKSEEEEVVLYIFGGSKIDGCGYCDPELYALVKLAPRNFLQGNNTGRYSSRSTSSKISSISKSSAVSATGSYSSAGEVYEEDREDTDSYSLSSQITPIAMLKSLAVENELRPRCSIWENLQSRTSSRGNPINDTGTRAPNNWDEMKLSLTHSRSNRIPTIKDSSVHNNTNTATAISPTTAVDADHLAISSSMKSLRHVESAPVLNEFSFRSIATHNHGSLSSPWHLPAMNKGDGGSPQQSYYEGRQTGSPLTSSRPNSSHQSPSRIISKRGDLEDNLSLIAEQRAERIQLIKATLNPVIRSKTKVTARETYNQLFPIKFS